MNRLAADATDFIFAGATVNANSYAAETAKISPIPIRKYGKTCQRTVGALQNYAETVSR